MKKIVVFIALFCICLSISACSAGSNSAPTHPTHSDSNSTQVHTPYTPNKQDLREGIKDNFKDPDSVQIGDCYWAWKAPPEGYKKGYYYILCTVRAKNGFGGYAEPKTYSVAGVEGEYELQREWGAYSDEQIKSYFDYHGCKGEIYTMP